MSEVRARRFSNEQKDAVIALVLGTVKDQIESGDSQKRVFDGRTRYVIKFRESEDDDWETLDTNPKSFGSLEGANKHIAQLVESEDDLHAINFDVKERKGGSKEFNCFECPKTVSELAEDTGIDQESVVAITNSLNKKFEEEGFRILFKRSNGFRKSESLKDVLANAGISFDNFI